MRPLDPIRAWLSKPVVFIPIGILMWAYLVYTSGRLLRNSALWGSRGWLAGALAGLAFAMIGLLMAWLSIRRQTPDGEIAEGSRGGFRGLGVAYMAVVLIMFLATHSRIKGPIAHADSPLVVAMLSCQLALLVGILIVLAIARPGRTEPSDGQTGSRRTVSAIFRRRPRLKAEQGGLRSWRKRR
jgi:hypothetical protein